MRAAEPVAPDHAEKLRRPDLTQKETTKDTNWWAFLPLSKAAPPANSKFLNPIDRFVLAKAAEKKLKLSPPADKRTLIRRAYFDLLGLPPSPEEVAAFVRDKSPDAWPKLLDRLLDSPHYGERWARHWLDVARFAESSGFEHDYDREGAFYYRDFVIKALNADMPYDQFVKWQIAGDEFEPENPLALTATGFLGAGVFPTQITANEVERTRYDALDDMLATTSSAMLGLTVGCCRCHDHKYDPFPTRDYYRMLSTFTTTVRSVIDLDVEPEKTRKSHQQWELEHLPLLAEIGQYENTLQPKFDEWLAKGGLKHASSPRPSPPSEGGEGEEVALRKVWTVLKTTNVIEWARAGKTLSAEERGVVFDWWKLSDAGWQAHNKKIMAHAAKEPKGKTKVLVCAEGYEPLRMHTQGADFFPETYILKRGSVDQKNGVATQGFLQVLNRTGQAEDHWKWQPPEGAKYSGRRRSLANWLTDADTGAGDMVARTMVNRLWQHHFGRGIVPIVNDFGHAGIVPSHPELLDWLAGELIRNGWKLKPIHKAIMMSATYMQSTAQDRAKEMVDLENHYFCQRMPRRLEGEAIRDSILSVSGELDATMFGPGTKDENSKRRSVYFTVKRSQLMGSMVAFDQPEPLVSQGVRPTTTVAPQALFLMNSPQVREWAGAFAKKVMMAGKDNGGIAKRAYQLALGRNPTWGEARDAAAFLKRQEASYVKEKKGDGRLLAVTDFCQIVFGLNEFVYEN